MLHGMAEQAMRRRCSVRYRARHSWVTVVVMMLALLLAVYLNYIMPESVFLVIASLATFATVWVWIVILFSQIAFRRSLSKEQVKQLAFPLRGGVFTSVVGNRVPGVHHRPDRLLPDHARLAVRQPGLGGIAAGGILVQGQPSEKTRRWRRSKTKWKNTG